MNKNKDIEMDSKLIFQNNIKTYYSEKNNGNYSEKLIDDLSNDLAEYFFNQYSNFRHEYPKAIKRYSSLKLKDLENPFTHDRIISFVKKRKIEDYIGFCSMLFEMNKEDFLKYEKSRDSFNNEWW
jgi:hypothetical protein